VPNLPAPWRLLAASAAILDIPVRELHVTIADREHGEREQQDRRDTASIRVSDSSLMSRICSGPSPPSRCRAGSAPAAARIEVLVIIASTSSREHQQQVRQRDPAGVDHRQHFSVIAYVVAKPITSGRRTRRRSVRAGTSRESA